ncbi:hypothetical protein PoB_004173100 [Plakobranchus ocellatus]|uniref:Uncharacterized protein n=1 Tax=Plakobranchus ocellatus TaxID=259542 RepID=A0AAV4B8R5_9GAST|nr:hypothetical protein PoB_004173100 [Plakobranchus ocellatus]
MQWAGDQTLASHAVGGRPDSGEPCSRRETRLRRTIQKPVHSEVISGFLASVRPGHWWRGSNLRQKVPADLRADSLATVPPKSPIKNKKKNNKNHTDTGIMCLETNPT